MTGDLYHQKQTLKNTVKRIKGMDIPEEDKEVILDLKKECEAQGLSVARVLFYISKLKNIARWKNKPLKEMEKSDVKDLVRRLEKGEITKDNGREYSEWSKKGYRVTIKKLFQFLEGYEWNSRKYPEKVRWIDTTRDKNEEKRHDILSEEDVKKMVRAVDKARDKAFVIGLYESGCRIGEFLGLRIKNLSFNEHGVKLNVKGKTGTRKVLLVSASPHLSNWLKQHPKRDKREAPLWVSLASNYKGKPLKYNGARKILKKAAKKAGVDKPVNPHNFRHSRATHLANELTEAQMCEYFGWVQGSDQPATYVHLSGRDVDNAILNVYGIEKEREKSNGEKLRLKKCPRCEKKNSPEAEYCNRCGAPLTEDARRITEEDMKTGMEAVNEKMVKSIVEKMKDKIEDEVREQVMKELNK